MISSRYRIATTWRATRTSHQSSAPNFSRVPPASTKRFFSRLAPWGTQRVQGWRTVVSERLRYTRRLGGSTANRDGSQSVCQKISVERDCQQFCRLQLARCDWQLRNHSTCTSVFAFPSRGCSTSRETHGCGSEWFPVWQPVIGLRRCV